MTLTPTKAHSQFMPALATIPHSLREYGHEDLELIFTDNVRADKSELETVFPSLLCDVEPILASSTLEHLAVPSDWSTSILDTSFTITSCLNLLMDALCDLPTDQYLDVAMDMEWSVSLPDGISSRVSLVSIAFGKSLYLIPVRGLIPAKLPVADFVASAAEVYDMRGTA